MIILEIVLILLVVALQVLVFLQNRARAAALADLFPDKSQLFMQPAARARMHTRIDPVPLLLQGKPYVLNEEPGKRFTIAGRDGEFYKVAEADLDNGSSTSFLLSQQELEALPAKEGFGFLNVEEGGGSGLSEVPAVHQPSDRFALFLHEINEYLQRNGGAESGLETIRDMSQALLKEASEDLQARKVQALYIGFIGAFFSLMLGLLSLASDGLNDESIQHFIVSGAVAMGCSFFGLLFTFLSNTSYHNARRVATIRFNDWLSFLQLQLLPRLHNDLTRSLGSIQEMLDAFNQDFLKRVSDFNSVFSNLNQYVAMQERFISALQESDYSQLTESNLRFFEQIQKNESLFERFGQYLQHLNESMDTGREAAADIREIVGQLRQLDDVQGYLRHNEELIRKQLGYLAAHQDKMDNLTQGIQQHFIEAGDEIGKLVRQRMQLMQREEQDAGEQLRQHFDRLKQENVYQKLADQLQPIRQIEGDVHNMQELFADTLKHLLETQQYLIRKINQDGQTQGRMLKEMELLNNHMQQLSERKSWFQRILGGS